jgi:hypothetical protein
MVNNSTSETDNHLSLKPFNTNYIPRHRVFEIQVMAWDRHTNVAMLNRKTYINKKKKDYLSFKKITQYTKSERQHKHGTS